MAATDLCSLSEVRSFLQKPTTDTNQDAIISTLITRASLEIMREFDREFAPASTSTVRKFEWHPGAAWVDLAPYDLRTVTLLRLDSDQTTPTTLTTDEYRLWPRPARDGVYQAIRLRPTTIVSPSWQFPDVREVEVTGTWGFAAVPEDIKDACVKTVSIWLRRDVSAFSTTFNITEDHIERPEPLPQAVVGALNNYRRTIYG